MTPLDRLGRSYHGGASERPVEREDGERVGADTQDTTTAPSGRE